LKSGLQHAWQLCRRSSNLVVATAIVKKSDCACFLKKLVPNSLVGIVDAIANTEADEPVCIIQPVYQVDMSRATASAQHADHSAEPQLRLHKQQFLRGAPGSI